MKPLATLDDLVFFAGDDALDLVLLAGAEAGGGFFLFLDPPVETAVDVVALVVADVVALVEAVAGFLPLSGPKTGEGPAAGAGPEAGAGPDDVALAGGGLGGAEVAG